MVREYAISFTNIYVTHYCIALCGPVLADCQLKNLFKTRISESYFTKMFPDSDTLP